MTLTQSLVFLLLIALVWGQNSTTPSKIPIELNELYNITVEKDQTAIYTLTVKGLKPNESLFIEAASPIYDPYEIPTVMLKSDDNYSKLCTQETNEFLGICEVPSADLSEGKTFEIEIKCHQKCSLQLQSFLSDTLQIEFGQKIGIVSQKSMDTLQQLKIQVPQDLNFTDIFIMASFLNEDDILEGAELYVNVGDEAKPMPKVQDYMYKGREAWGNGVGVFLNSKEVKAGDWIKVLVVLGVGVDLEFYSQGVNGKNYDILLNTAYKDFTSEDETKLYVLDLSESLNSVSNTSSLKEKTVQIIFVVYSGVPSIKVGFDQKFTTYMDNYDIQGTFSYLLTPEIRKLNNFTGKVYIEVKSFWSSNYYLYTMTVSDRFYKLSQGVAQLNRAEPQQIQNYIYESFIVADKNATAETESFKLKIEIIEGMADVGIRRCRSLEVNNSLDCVLTSVGQLDEKEVKDSFDELDITLRRDWDAYELLFQYQAQQCQLYKQYQAFKIFNCQFQVVVFPPKSSTKQLIYSVVMFQNRQQGTLKQSYAFKDFLYADTYHYYEFELPDEVSKVEEVMFFMTVISGDAAIMGTTNEKWKYMEFSDTIAQNDIYLSLFNSLTFKKGKLDKKFFIAVYAYDASDITLSVVVKRGNPTNTTDSNTTNNNTDTNNTNTNTTTQNTTGQNTTNQNTTNANTTNQNTTQISTIYLSQGLSQQYTLNKGYQVINFAFTSNTKQNITLDLIQIQGTLTFTITKEGANSTIPCLNGIQAGQLKCTFDAEQYAKYIVQVKAEKSDVQTFSISYYTAAVCKKYSFNLPQFVFLAAKQKQCSSYSITDKSKPLQVITSFSTLDLLSTSIQFTATFNDNHSIDWKGREKEFTVDEVKEFCKSETLSNCNMKLEYTGDDYTNQRFYFVVEQVGKEMALFDGIVRKVVDQKMTQTKGKFFYYELTSMVDSVKIFTTNRDNVGYYVGAKFVDIMQFTASPDSLYLPYRDNISTLLANAFETRLLPQRGTSVIQIEPQKFNSSCKQCVILISVYGLKKESSEANIFEIEVTQTESFLYLGETQTGFLSQDQIYVYDVYGNPDAESLISLRDFMKESDKQANCYTASISQVGKLGANPIAYGQHVLPKSSSTFKVYIENVGDDVCAYQISFSALTKSISEITSYMAVELKLQNYETAYYLHYHSEQSSFQILNYIKSGDMKIAVNRVNETSTIEVLMQKNLEMYDFVSRAGDSFLLVSNGSKFCTKCYYMIAVKGDPNVQAEMAIVRQNDSIGLTTYGILKQSLKKGDKYQYVYYTIFDFNLSIPLLFGQLQVTILTPNKTTFYNQSIQLSTQIFIPKPIIPEGQFIDFYNDDSRFSIIIEAVKDSSYYISVKRRNVALRVYEGIPMTLSFGKNTQNKTVEFVNINDDDHVSILLQLKNDEQETSTIEVTAEVIKENQTKPTKLQKPQIRTSQKSLNYLFQSVKGTYFITLKSSVNSLVSFILVKRKLTHLMTSNANLFTQNGTFQIYTPGHNFMIVVDTCLSEVEVKASDKYDSLKSDSNQSLVMLEHANYGGHYVITAQNVQGQYFVEVNPKNAKDPMLYIISYFYYDKSDHMPYSKVDVDPEISYELGSDKIIFELKPVRMLPSKQKFNIISTYTLYISNNPNTSTMNSRCDLNVGFSVSQAATGDQEVIQFPIDYNVIANEVGPSTDIYYVSAKVKVKFQGESVITGYTPYIDLAYTRLQLTQSTHKVEYRSETTSSIKYILLWIVVPVLISLVLFGLALKFCINKYRMLYPSTLVEEDVGESEDQMKSAEMKPTDSLTNT